MTTETRQRIRAYKRMLPDLRERVIAVALLFAMSTSMLATASYAWITLSRAPEVSGMSTTVAANGNLEIALAQGMVKDGKIEPEESAVGDSSSSDRENWGISEANATWGNLVNLSDPKYGLDKIALRPALLSSYGLDRAPLHGATYGLDGRVIDTVEQYEYSSLKDIGGGDYQLTAGEDVQYGVRAVSSMITENTVGAKRLKEFESVTNAHYGRAIARYQELVSDGKNGNVTPTVFYDKTAVAALQGMVSTFAQDKVDDGNSSYANYVWYLHQMMIELRAIMQDHESLGLLELANWQAYIKNGNLNDKTFSSFDQVVQAYNDGTLANDHKVTLTTLKAYLDDLQTLNECISGMQEMADSCHPVTGTFPDIKWKAIEPYINKMVDLSTATMETDSMKETRVYSIGMSTATSLLNEKNARIRIYDGVIKNFEDRTGARMNAAVTVTVTYIMTVNVGGRVFTTSTSTNYAKDVTHALGLDNSGASGQKYAKDTYGMALDFWVRTNAPSSVLVLEGTTLYEYQNVTFEDENKNVITVYELSRTVDENLEVYDIYQNPDDGKWYHYGSKSEVDSELLNSGTKAVKQEKKVTGYRGENRIWEDWETLLDNGYIAEDATTQGAGSCFIFYADNPAEQAKLMEMMHAFTITFIDISGTELATAVLDTENAYINQGKITAPLVVTEGVTYTDNTGASYTGIMELTQNQATWLTAIVYLNGTMLQNDNVLATSNIVGQLNLQFGNNATLDVREDENLQMQHRTITAEAVSVEDSSKKSTNSTDVIAFEYDANGHDVRVNLNVDGDQPERISGFFVRVINEAQGTRGDPVDFKKNDDGTWTGTFKLTSPGTYVLNTLQVDGIEYSLRDKTQSDKGNHPSVVINGLKLQNVRTSHLSGVYRTDQKSISVGVYAKIEADQALTPKTVWAQFFSEDGNKQYNGQLTFNPNNEGGMWEGTVSLNSSGTYYLRYLTIDGIPFEVAPNSQVRLECYMGLNCRITCGRTEREFLYKGDAFNLEMRAVIMDDGNQIVPDLDGVHLYYHSDSSSDDDNGMHAPLTWDSTNQWYYGTFELDTPGTYAFNRLSIDGSDLMSARSAPVFTASTPDPPTWDVGYAAAEARQLAFDTPATMTLRLKDAAGAYAWAEMQRMTRNADGSYTATNDVISVQHSKKTAEDGSMKFSFNLDQDGIWMLKKVKCQAVYNGTTAYPYGGDTYYEVAVPAEDQIITEVVKTINADLYYNGTPYEDYLKVNFGKDAQGNTTGTIFTAYKPSVEVKITDAWNNEIPEVTAVNWNITHSDAKMPQYGGYSGAGYGVMEPKTMTRGSDGITYTSPAVTMDLAGVYETNVTITLDGFDTPYTVSVQPEFHVYSKSPTVTVTGVSPANASHSTVRLFNTATPASASDLSTVMFNEVNLHTENSATVYMYATLQSGSIDTEAAHPKKPKVSLTMSDMSANITSATMTFAHETNSAYDAKFNFAYSDGVYTASQSIGGFDDGSDNALWVENWPVLYPAGSAEKKSVTVVYNNKPYEVNLSHSVTISNMLAPSVYADLTVDEVSYTGNKRIYSTDGKTITLPNTTWTQDGIEVGSGATDTGWVAETTVVTDYSYRTYTTGALFWKETHHEYMPYYWKEFVRTVTGSQTPYTITYKIVKWTVNGQDIDVSKGPVSIPADSAITAKATVTAEKVYGTTATTSTKSYLYGYVKGEQTETKPDGKQIGATVTSSGGAFVDPSYGYANTATEANMHASKTDYENCANRAK